MWDPDDLTPEEFEEKEIGEPFFLWAVAFRDRDYIHKVFLENDHAQAFIEETPKLCVSDRDDPKKRELPLFVKKIQVIKADDGFIYYAPKQVTIDVWTDEKVRERALSKLSPRELDALGYNE